MVTLFSKLIGSEVISQSSSSKLGRIDNIVFDKENFTIAAIILNKKFFFSPTKIIAASDLLALSPDLILIRSDDSPVYIKELPKLKQSLKSFPVGTGQKVVSYSSKKIGTAYDLLIDLDSKQIKSLYIHNFLDERIIPISTVIGFQKGVFIIKDEFSEIKIPSLSAELSDAK